MRPLEWLWWVHLSRLTVLYIQIQKQPWAQIITVKKGNFLLLDADDSPVDTNLINCYISNIKPCRSIWSINRSLQWDSSLVQLETSCCSWSISRCPPADQSKHLLSFPGATWWCMLHVNRQITNKNVTDERFSFLTRLPTELGRSTKT